MDKKIQEILADLYKIEPKLKESEAKPITIIKALLESKPNTKFDQAFALNLKAKLIQNKPTLKSFNLGFMKKIIYVLSGMLGAFIIVVAGYFGLQNGLMFGTGAKENKMLAFEPSIVQLKENAFGKLVNEEPTDVGVGGSGEVAQATGSESPRMEAQVPSNVTKSENLAPTAKIMAASDNAVSEASPDRTTDTKETVTVNQSGIAATPNLPPDANTDAKMVSPPYEQTVYKYIYEGDDFSSLLKDEKVDVLRKVKGNLNKSAVLDFINNFSFGLLNMSKFSDLYLQNISLTEDREFGYTIYADLEYGNISVNQNWLKWPQCDSECWNTRKPIKLEDLPEDTEVTQATDAFLQEYGVDTSTFGKPIVNKYWLRDIEMAKLYGYEPYIPESISVTYPSIINSLEVYYDSGTVTGMEVSYDVRLKKVTGIYNLSSSNFESSAYEAVTDKEAVMEWIDKGGWQSYPVLYDQMEGVKTETVEVKIGTPKLGYMKYWNYDSGANEELLIPALIFPVTQKPEGDAYFYKDSLMIPLAKEFLEQETNPPYTIMETSSSIKR